MTDVVHHTAVAVAAAHRGMPDLAGFRETMPPELRGLVVGPFESVVNGFTTAVFLPDGSKEGWELSGLVDVWRRRFIDLFAFAYDDGSSPYTVLEVAAVNGVPLGATVAGRDELFPPPPASFACPRCGAVSHNPNDVREGYCGRCHDWTRS